MRFLILIFALSASALAQYSPRPASIDQSNVAITGGTINSATVGATTPATVQQPTIRTPAIFATGAGTEASPFTHADLTGGIQTSIDALAAARGGTVRLGAYRFNVTAADGVRISTAGVSMIGEGIGFNVDPNGEAEGVTGAKINTTTHGVRIGTNSSKRGGVLLRDFYIYGPDKTNGSEGITLDHQLDQPRFENINISQVQYGIKISSVLDAGNFKACSVLNAGYGVYSTGGALISYTKFNECEFSDNDKGGVYFEDNSAANNQWPRLVGCTVVRNARSLTTDGCNVYVGIRNAVIEGCIIRYAGHHNINNTNVAADGIILNNDSNLVTGCQITDNSNGCGIRVRGDNNVISGCFFSGNTTDIIIEPTADGTVIIGAPAGVTITNNGTNTLVLNGRETTNGGSWPIKQPDVWYKTDRLNLAEAASIQTFFESSGNYRTASQATGGSRPTYKENIVNAMPVSRFALASSQMMTTGWTPAYGSGDMTFFAVAVLTATAGPGQNAIFGNLQNSGSFNGFALCTTAAGKLKANWRVGGSDKAVTEAGTSSGSFFIATMRRSGGTGELFINGVSAGTVSATGSVNGETFSVGAFRSAENAEFWNGDIAEIIGYGTAISTTQRQEIEDYLSAKYGIAVTH